MEWTRNGPVPTIFDLPFLKLGQILVSPDYILSFQPPLLTAALAPSFTFGSASYALLGMSLLLTLSGAFGTMLWPYAYIGVETKQSFFVLLAGYLALANGKLRTWPRLLLFAATCGCAISMKSVGIVLWPAIAYLIYVQFRGGLRSHRRQIFAIVVVIGTIWALGALGRHFYWAPKFGSATAFRFWLTDSAFQVFSNIIGVFGSPTKGLFVYAPVLLASIYAVPRAFRVQRETVIYAVLVTLCYLGLISLLRSPTDDLWGCRYMHVAIAPLILCIGVAWPRFRWRREGALVPLVLVGLVISFLGAFYYYGVMDYAMRDAGQNTLEWITGDSVWNHIMLNARLFGVWFHGGTAPVMWTPAHIWVWEPTADALPWKSINLRQYCQPQSFVVRFWDVPKSGVVLVIFLVYVGSLVVGLLSLTWVVLRTIKHPQVADVEDLTVVGNHTHTS